MRNIGGSIAIIVVGAILAFAVEDRLAGVDLFVLGVIIMVGGGVWLVISLTFLSGRGRTEVLTTTEVTERQSIHGGDVVTRRTDREVFPDG